VSDADERCCGSVGTGFHNRPCGQVATTITSDGRHWCRRHNPKLRMERRERAFERHPKTLLEAVETAAEALLIEMRGTRQVATVNEARQALRAAIDARRNRSRNHRRDDL